MSNRQGSLIVTESCSYHEQALIDAVAGATAVLIAEIHA